MAKIEFCRCKMMKKLVAKTKKINTVETLTDELFKLGVQNGSTLLVHSSLSSIGWVNGGPVAVIDALMNVVTTNGTLVMPSQTGDLSDPVNWGNPPVPEDWWEEIRQTMPPYHPEITPTRGMGQIADQKSTRLNSSHVATSYEVLLIRYKYHRQYC